MLATDAVMEWIIEYVAVIISRHKVGKDGKTPYRRLMGRESRAGIVEFGEQVLGLPRRSPESRRKRALKSKWVLGTWVGIVGRTNENSFISLLYVQRVAVSLAINSNGKKAQLVCGSNNATGNFAAISNEYFLNVSRHNVFTHTKKVCVFE